MLQILTDQDFFLPFLIGPTVWSGVLIVILFYFFLQFSSASLTDRQNFPEIPGNIQITWGKGNVFFLNEKSFFHMETKFLGAQVFFIFFM